MPLLTPTTSVVDISLTARTGLRNFFSTEVGRSSVDTRHFDPVFASSAYDDEAITEAIVALNLIRIYF